MSTRRSVCLIAFACLALALTTGCAPKAGDPPSVSGLLTDVLETRWQEFTAEMPRPMGGVAMEIMGPSGRYFVSYNMEEKVSNNSHFRGGAVTKTFTAAAVLMLAQQGKLNLDDPITANIPGTGRPYVPDTENWDIPYKKDITIRQLLAHKAGVYGVAFHPAPESANVPYAGKRYIDYVKEELDQPQHTFTLDEIVGVVAETEAFHVPPGQEFIYSDTGYTILGKIIERVSGQPYAEFVHKNLVMPNRLDDTLFPSQGSQIRLPMPYVRGYTVEEGKIYESTFDNVSAHVAEGNIVSTCADLTRWVRALFRGRSGLEPAMVTAMADCRPTGDFNDYYGLGCAYMPGLGYGHSGALPGYVTVMRYDPETRISVVLFANVLYAPHAVLEMDALQQMALEAKRIMTASP